MEYGYPILVTPGVASARSSPFSFTTIPMISTGLPVSEAPSLAITSSLSAICLTCFGETKLTASICLNPASINCLRYAAFVSVGIKSASPCQASLGHSTSFGRSAIGFCFLSAPLNKISRQQTNSEHRHEYGNPYAHPNVVELGRERAQPALSFEIDAAHPEIKSNPNWCCRHQRD